MRKLYRHLQDAFIAASLGWFVYLMGTLIVDIAQSFRKHPAR